MLFRSVDGRSMVSLFKGARPSLNEWRSAYLLEFYGYNPKDDESAGEPVSKSGYLGLRTSDYLYVEYADGFVELYDLKADPYEMENIAATADKAFLQYLSGWLHALSTCASRQCSTLDQGAAK